MDILYLLVPIAIILAGIVIGVFLWAVRSGQFEDLDSPAHRILFDEDRTEKDTEGSQAGADNTRD